MPHVLNTFDAVKWTHDLPVCSELIYKARKSELTITRNCSWTDKFNNAFCNKKHHFNIWSVDKTTRLNWDVRVCMVCIALVTTIASCFGPDGSWLSVSGRRAHVEPSTRLIFVAFNIRILDFNSRFKSEGKSCRRKLETVTMLRGIHRASVYEEYKTCSLAYV